MSRPELVLLSGAFSPTPTGASVEQNLATAVACSRFCIQHNVAFICPNLFGIYPSMVAIPYAQFLGWVLRTMLPLCTRIVLMPGWETSGGAEEEVSACEKLGYPVMLWADFVNEKERL